MFPDLSVTSSIENNIELNSRGAQKGLALAALCRETGVSMEQTMAFGDGLNDISVLRAAKIGIAMGNAAQEIRAIADYVTDTNDHDGVAAALLHFGIVSA